MTATMVTEVAAPPVLPEKSWMPTRKWWAAQVVAAGALATMIVSTNSWDTEETLAIIGWIVQSVTTYICPNADTLGGVPVKKQ
jgi:hypothetical protein